MSKKTSSERRRHRAPVSLLFDFTYLFLVLIEVFVVLKSLEFLILLFNLQIKSRGTFGNNTSQRQGTFKLQQFVDSRSSIRQVNNWIHFLFCVELTAVAYAYVAEFLSFLYFVCRVCSHKEGQIFMETSSLWLRRQEQMLWIDLLTTGRLTGASQGKIIFYAVI